MARPGLACRGLQARWRQPPAVGLAACPRRLGPEHGAEPTRGRGVAVLRHSAPTRGREAFPCRSDAAAWPGATTGLHLAEYLAPDLEPVRCGGLRRGSHGHLCSGAMRVRQPGRRVSDAVGPVLICAFFVCDEGLLWSWCSLLFFL